MRGTDDDDIIHDKRSSGQSYIRERKPWIISIAQSDEQINDPTLTKVRIRHACLRIKRHEVIARSHIDDSFFVAVSPVSDAATSALARRFVKAFSLLRTPQPEDLAGCCVKSHNVTGTADIRVKHAINFDRGRGIVEIRRRPKILGRKLPGNLKVTDVFCVDLVQRRITLGEMITVIFWPVTLVHRRA